MYATYLNLDEKVALDAAVAKSHRACQEQELR